MKNNNLYVLLLSIIFIFQSCILDDQLIIPENSIVFTKEKTILKEKLLISYFSSKNNYILFFSDSECSFCELELNDLQLFLKKHPELSPILVLNTSFPEIYILNAMKNSIFLPTVLYKNFDMIVQNNLSPNTKYIIVDNELNILCKSKAAYNKRKRY
ncbi:MAG: hypothetical protein WC125_00650 [Bacteroidales bacterium]